MMKTLANDEILKLVSQGIGPRKYKQAFNKGYGWS